MSFRSAEYGAFLSTGGRGTSSPRSSHSHFSIGSFSFSVAEAQLEVVLVVYQRVLELNSFHSFLCLTKMCSPLEMPENASTQDQFGALRHFGERKARQPARRL